MYSAYVVHVLIHIKSSIIVLPRQPQIRGFSKANSPMALRSLPSTKELSMSKAKAESQWSPSKPD